MAVGFAATGCSGPTPTGSDADPVPAKGGTLHVLSTIDLEHLDPARNYVTSSQDVGRLIYRTLTTPSAAPGSGGGTIVPDLATDLGRASDGAKTWTFTLKEGVKYEDGRSITSKDIKYGVERTFAAELPEGPPYARMWLAGGDKYAGPYKDRAGLASIETPDDKTIVFKLNRPVNDFGSAVSLPMFAPVPQDKDTGVAYDARPFSSGPYKVAQFELKKQLTLERNTHWDAATDGVRKGLPDRIVIDLNLDAQVVDQRLIQAQGEDANAVAFEPISSAAVAQVMTDPNLKARLVAGLGSNTRFLSLRTSTKPLDNLKVRQAIAVALDRDALRLARGGPIAGDIATSILPPAVPGHITDDPFPSTDHKGDPEQAKKLLLEAGYANGVDLTLDTTSSPGGLKVGEAVQASLARANIRVKINGISGSVYWSTVMNPSQQHDMVVDGWTPDWPGASTFLPIVLDGRNITATGNNNRAQYNNAEVNAEFDRIATLLDVAAANKAYGELDRKITQDAAVVPFLWDKAAIMVGPNVTGAYGHVAFVGRLDLVSLGLKKS